MNLIESTEYTDSLKSIQRFFTNSQKGGIAFAITDDELLQKQLVEELKSRLAQKQITINVFSWKKNPKENQHPLIQLQTYLNKHSFTKGLILTDWAYLWVKDKTVFTNLLIQLNFSREALLDLNIPILFLVNKDILGLFPQYAIDLYNQRSVGNYYFEQFIKENGLIEKEALILIKDKQLNISQPQNILAILKQQLAKAELLQLPPKQIASDIVEPLFNVSQANPDKPFIVGLLKKYETQFDKKKPTTLLALASAYQTAGLLNESEDYYTQALIGFKKLNGGKAHAYLPEIANTITALANLHSNKNEFDKAAAEYEEALHIFRELAKANPQTYLPYVATSLNNLANLHSNKNEFDKAAAEYEGALHIFRELAKTNPQTYLPYVATSLNNLANLHSNKNEFDKADAEYEEALNIRREFAQANPQIYLPEVAGTLNNLANLHSNKNEIDRATVEYEEALHIFRELAKANPQIYLPVVSGILNNLANLHSNKNEFDKAAAEYEEALKIRSELAQANPQTYLPYVATTALNLSIFYLQSRPNKELSLQYAAETLRAAIPSFKDLPLSNQLVEKSLEIVENWQIDSSSFLEEIIANPKKNS